MNKFLIYFFFVIGLPSLIYSEEWHVKKSDSNLVKFTSSTPVLDFNGITEKIDGYIYWEGDEIFGEKNEIYFEVDLNSLETGIGKRDRDMREDVLETDKYPITHYTGSFVEVMKIDNIDNSYKVSTEGKFYLHGVEREAKINAEINIYDNAMNVVCEFSLFLKDYEIEAPTLLAFIKVADEIKLKLNFGLEKITENKN